MKNSFLVGIIVLATTITVQAVTVFYDDFYDLSQWSYDGNAAVSDGMLVLEPASGSPWHASATSIATFTGTGKYTLTFTTDANGGPAFQEFVTMPGGLTIGFRDWSNLAQVSFKGVVQSGTVAGTGVSAYGMMRTIKMVLEGQSAEIYVNGTLGWSAMLSSDPDFATYNTIRLFGQYSVISNKYEDVRLDYEAAETVGATHYYVSNSGSDSNAGTSESAPWATLDKVNNFTFSPGDVICFERGGTWRGYLVPCSGTSGSPVTYTSYGSTTSAKPLLLGSVEMNSTSYWTSEGSNIWSGTLPSPSVTGSELLPNPSFSSNGNNWTLYYTNGASASSSRTVLVYDSSPASLKVTCSSTGSNAGDIQLWTAPVSLTMGKFYKLTFRAKSTTAFDLGVGLLKNTSPYTNYYSANSKIAQTIGTSWATHTIYYEANTTASDARIDFYMGASMPAGSTLYIDTLSFKELSGPVLISDIGNIIFNNGEAVGTKVWSTADLNVQNKFYYEPSSMSVKMYSAANPASLYSDIEFAQGNRWGMVVVSNSYVTFDGLALAYGGAHGFVMAGSDHIIINNCDIRYMGGGDQDGVWSSGTTRYGNGIEVWEGNHDIFVENCTIEQIYDAGVTNQGQSENTQYNIYYRYNTIENCQYGYELWNHSSTSSMYHIFFDHNTCCNGGSWSSSQRPDAVYGTFMQFFYSYASVPGYIYITDNTFSNALNGAIAYEDPWTDRDNVIVDNNTYYQSASDLLIRCTNYWFYATVSDFYWYQYTTGKDENSTLVITEDQSQVNVSGDANGDGVVNVSDLSILAANYGTTTGATWKMGDFNNDGAVNVSDLSMLAANYGTGSTASMDFAEDYAGVFGPTVNEGEISSDDSADDSMEDLSSSTCNALGLSLIAGLMLMGLGSFKLQE